MTGGLHDMMIVGLLCAALATATAVADSVDLSEGWKFARGDDAAWADPAFDDASWQPMEVGVDWGAAGGDADDYDGFGWYRLTFRLPSELRDRRDLEHRHCDEETCGCRTP